MCVCFCFRVWAQDSRTKTERQSKGRIRGSEIAGGWGSEIVCFLAHQGHPELKCDWKSPVCLGCLPHEIIQTGCSADNVTVLTTPPFSFCFKLSVKWQECGNVIPTHTRTHAQTSRGRDAHSRPDTVRRAILTHTDGPTGTRSCVYIIAHNYTPSQILVHIHFSPRADELW